MDLLPPSPSLTAYHIQFHPYLLRIRANTVESIFSGNGSLCPRPRPFYHMHRGYSIILSRKTLVRLQREDPHHPRIRRHDAAVKAIEFFHLEFHPQAEPRLKLATVPPNLSFICDHYNHHYLIRPTDLHITPMNIWRIIYRTSYSERNCPITPELESHDAIYIQQRIPTSDEVGVGRRMKRRRSLCKQQIGSDYNKIATNTTIVQSGRLNMFYLVTNLHVRHHGSIATRDLSSRGIMFDFLHIPNSSITPELAGPLGFASVNDVYVAYGTNELVQELDKKMVPGLITLHHDLTVYLLSCTKTDATRANGAIIDGEASTSVRVRFGFGRIQRLAFPVENRKVLYWDLDGANMPTITYHEFTKLPKSLRGLLMQVFETAQIFVDINLPNSFQNKHRTRSCAKKLNETLGFPYSSSKFEYYDIVLSRNTILGKHIDEKNDGREGYNVCVVYSFFQVINKLDYKVSIIMTTRCTVGAALEQKG